MLDAINDLLGACILKFRVGVFKEQSLGSSCLESDPGKITELRTTWVTLYLNSLGFHSLQL